ncbi:XRE family transcriptional regulator [Pantoea vagans]|uniref:XRE family transcriptional regulator n=3 Tax=Pantoea TaxID=53335 RepID=A0ABY3LIP4_9GAMM|nr:XRE family transcriptional regulator [Pantoea vagans]
MNQIAKMRKQMGISQVLLARTIGWGASRLANYEHCVRTPGLNDCRKIVVALNKVGCACTLDDIFPPHSEIVKHGLPNHKR